MSFGLALLHQNSRILLSKSVALSLVHIFIIDHWSHLSVALSQSSPLVREKKSLHLSCLKWIMNKARSRGLRGQRGIIMQKGRTWNSVHLIFDYDLLLKRMKLFPTGTGRILIAHNYVKRIHGLDPSPDEKGSSRSGGHGEMMEGWMVKKERRWKVFFEVAFCISLLSLNPPDQAILPGPALTSQRKNIHTVHTPSHAVYKTGYKDHLSDLNTRLCLESNTSFFIKILIFYIKCQSYSTNYKLDFSFFTHYMTETLKHFIQSLIKEN